MHPRRLLLKHGEGKEAPLRDTTTLMYRPAPLLPPSFLLGTTKAWFLGRDSNLRTAIPHRHRCRLRSILPPQELPPLVRFLVRAVRCRRRQLRLAERVVDPRRPRPRRRRRLPANDGNDNHLQIHPHPLLLLH